MFSLRTQNLPFFVDYQYLRILQGAKSKGEYHECDDLNAYALI